MTHINSILKYLNDDMSSEDKSDFLKRLEKDNELKEEYLSVLEIWDILKEELSELKAGEIKNREEILAEIFAKHDILNYRNKTPSQQEEKFKMEISRLIQNEKNKINKSQPGNSKRLLSIIIAIAASLALLIILLPAKPDPRSIAARYYEPHNDLYIKDHAVITRSSHIKAISNFHNKEFDKAKASFLNDSSLWKVNPWIRIYYAISSYELGNEAEAINILKDLSNHVDQNIASTSKWYLSLMLINQEKYIPAKPYLQELISENTRYRKKASRLLNAIKKEIS